MSEYSGSQAYADWVYPGGTVVLTGNQRTVSMAETIDFIDTTAGSDPRRTRLPSIADVTFSWQSLDQAGGTALQDALAGGVHGTINYYPEGNTSTKRKYIIGAYSAGLKTNEPYADVVELTCDFNGDGNFTRTTV